MSLARGALILIALMFIYPQARVSAQQAQVRVGLTAYVNSGEISIGSNELRVGFESGGSFAPSAVIYSAGGFSVVPAGLCYIRTNFFYDYETARQSADQFIQSGYKACVAVLDGGSFCVYLGGFSESEALAVKDALPQNFELLYPAAHRTAVTRDGYPVIVFDNPVKNGWISGIDTTALGSRRYRGAIEIYRAGQAVSAVNVLPMEEYLRSVVPSEMSSGWNIEALKAQAVASRSYAMSRADAHRSSGYSYCDGTHCQVYLGAASETDAASRAVNETAGVAAYYNAQPINAVFFASSGGATANSETVWTETVPYLRGVLDINEKTAKEWQRVFTLSDITSLLNSNGYPGSAVSVGISLLSPLGRVDKLTISGTGWDISLEKEEIRTFFSKAPGGSLESRMFNIGTDFNPIISERQPAMVFTEGSLSRGEYLLNGLFTWFGGAAKPIGAQGEISAAGADFTAVLNKNAPAQTLPLGETGGDTVVFTGKGNGHGVGMSQHGANGMAEAGYTYREILAYYYTGIEIR